MDILLELSDATVATNVAGLLEALRAATDRYAAGGDPALVVPSLFHDVEDALVFARMLAMLEVARVGADFLPSATEVEVEDLDPAYGRATRWVMDRKFATREEVAEMVRAAALLDGRPVGVIEREIRDKVQALAAATTEKIGAMFRDEIARSVARGETAAEFKAAFDAMIAEGVLPGGIDGYLDLVHHQEVANAYSVQREEAMEDPLIAPHVWGKVFINGRLPTSRSSHMAMHGVKLRKGSPAYEAVGPTPWSYNCTCTCYLLMEVDPELSEHKETPDAFARVSAIQRFDATEECCR